MSLRTVSWALLAIVAALVLLASLASANLAYRGMYPIAGVSITDVAAGREVVLFGLRGMRGTAAAWAAAWAILLLAAVLGPYRRGDVATWWGILASALVLAVVAGVRVLFIRPPAGVGAPLILLALVLIALLLDIKRILGSR